jgi:hypothetical protein
MSWAAMSRLRGFAFLDAALATPKLSAVMSILFVSLSIPILVFILGYVREFVNHTRNEYARGEVHENRVECLFSLLKPYLRGFGA